VDDLGASDRADALARAAVALGHSLGLGVLAEGVESAQQARLLQAAGCDEYQGHLASPSVSGEQFLGLLRGTALAWGTLASPRREA
jgi:EAL domain-containing protein (putative c-di-GMP-specific phosphodiesterase class I)